MSHRCFVNDVSDVIIEYEFWVLAIGFHYHLYVEFVVFWDEAWVSGLLFVGHLQEVVLGQDIVFSCCFYDLFVLGVGGPFVLSGPVLGFFPFCLLIVAVKNGVDNVSRLHAAFPGCRQATVKIQHLCRGA